MMTSEDDVAELRRKLKREKNNHEKVAKRQMDAHVATIKQQKGDGRGELAELLPQAFGLFKSKTS